MGNLEKLFALNNKLILYERERQINMTQDKNFRKTSKPFVANDTDYMSSFRNNVLFYISENGITLKDLAECSKLSVDTLKSFLYKNPKDCKLSTAVSLAKAMGVSIDELVGANTINPIIKENIAICRNLPDHALYLVHWYIKHQHYLYSQKSKRRKIISVVQVQCALNGNLKLTNNYTQMDITDLNKDIVSKIFFGIKLSCEHYMPHYSPYDTLLIANDRQPLFNENSAIIIDDNFYIAHRKIENGIAKYYSIRDGRYRVDEKDVDEIVGYICYVQH